MVCKVQIHLLKDVEEGSGECGCSRPLCVQFSWGQTRTFQKEWGGQVDSEPLLSCSCCAHWTATWIQRNVNTQYSSVKKWSEAIHTLIHTVRVKQLSGLRFTISESKRGCRGEDTWEQTLLQVNASLNSPWSWSIFFAASLISIALKHMEPLNHSKYWKITSILNFQLHFTTSMHNLNP